MITLRAYIQAIQNVRHFVYAGDNTLANRYPGYAAKIFTQVAGMVHDPGYYHDPVQNCLSALPDGSEEKIRAMAGPHHYAFLRAYEITTGETIRLST